MASRQSAIYGISPYQTSHRYETEATSYVGQMASQGFQSFCCTIRAMEREVRYCTTEDGVRIAYCVEGEGPPVLAVPGMWESFSLEHLIPEAAPFSRALGDGLTVIRYDARGSGLSQRVVDDVSLDGVVRDVEAVLLATGLFPASIWASLHGTPVAMAYAARHPERVNRLVLFQPYARTAAFLTPEAWQAFADFCRHNWQNASHALADGGAGPEHRDVVFKVAQLLRESQTGAELAQKIEQWAGFDLREEMRTIGCPVLVFDRVRDPVRDLRGQEVAAVIPAARFVPLTNPGGYGYFIGDSEAILDAIDTFLDEDPVTRRRPTTDKATPSASRAFRAVLFTDLVGHSEMMSRLGDDRGRAVLREHETITRNTLRQHGGTEVKTMGDGFMASFGSVTKALECAIALQRAFAEREGEPLSVRVGLNAGEPIEEGGDLFGATVILASRIAAKADGGEILVADTVRGLCSGKGFLFADRGEFVAKGFEEPVRVYEVRWRD